MINPQTHQIESHQPILVQSSMQHSGFDRVSDSLQHSSLQTQGHLTSGTVGRTDSVCSATEAKLLSYLDASPSTNKVLCLEMFQYSIKIKK